MQTSGSAGRLKAWIAGPSRELCGPARSRSGSGGGLLTMSSPEMVRIVARRGDPANRGRQPAANEVGMRSGPGARGDAVALDRAPHGFARTDARGCLGPEDRAGPPENRGGDG